VVNGATSINLYKSGATAITTGLDIPALLLPILDRKKDLRIEPAFATIASIISVRKSPFDNVLLRYALNMATDKKALTGFLRAGRSPARTLVARGSGYVAPESLPTLVEGHLYDVLSFDVERARSLLAKAGFGGGAGLKITYHYMVAQGVKEQAEILQQQWQRNLNIDVTLSGRENSVHWKMVLEADFTGVAWYAFQPTYLDPNPFLDPFSTASIGNPSGWTEVTYAATLMEANSTVSATERFRKLADCERRLLQAMPLVPMYFDSWVSLRKPFVRGLSGNLFDMRSFKYAWIDANWKTRR
jgi:oligopeptide transport system substrate-binding protein